MNNNVNAIMSAFGLDTIITTAPKKGPTLKEVREELVAELSAETAPTWRGINEALSARNWAVTPSKALYVAYFGGKEAGGLGDKVWRNIEARWTLLQATSAMFVTDWGLESLPQSERVRVYKLRKTKLFQQVRDILSFHGIVLSRDLKPSDLIAIGEAAIKYNFAISDGEVEARAVGLTAFIKAVIWGLLGRDQTSAVVDNLCVKAKKLVDAQAGTDPLWDNEAKPKFLRG